MTLLAPERLIVLLAVAALAGAYVYLQRRRSRFAVRFTNLELLDRVAPEGPGWRRHAPAAAFCLMLALVVVGFARPEVELRVPRERATVLVAVDVSGSMEATDVNPDRLTAAREAARSFVDELPERFNVGLVSFAGSASLVVAPTTQRDLVRDGVDRLRLGTGGTAIGEAVFTGLEAIRSFDARAGQDPPPARIVLLSDGANTSGRPPETAASAAAAAGVPVSTIAYGTPEGTITNGLRITPVPVDGATLRALAQATRGRFYEAPSAERLQQVYADLGSSIGFRTEDREIWPWFVGAGLLAAFAGAVGSLLWFSRIP